MSQPGTSTIEPTTTSAPSDPGWRLRLLGALELRHGTQVLRLPSRAAAALLARLAMAPQREHAREELIELLWPGVALDVGRNRLRQVLSTLKTTLSSPADGQAAALLQATRLTVSLQGPGLDCDVPAFEQAVRQRHWARARSLYQGELLPGFTDEWIEDERRRLAALAQRAAEQPDLPGPPQAASLPPPALPCFLGRYFGAEETAARLLGLLRQHRLVTVLGPGGAGKTRLVVELLQARQGSAAALGDALRQGPVGAADFVGVVFVSLLDCLDTAQADSALATALQPWGGSGPDAVALLRQRAQGQPTLLVLDNAEPLAERAAAWVRTLLACDPDLHVLVTSRRPLGLAAEQEFVLAPLTLPAADATLEATASAPALALLLERARAVRRDLVLDEHNRATLVDLAQALQGWPLAIELAASRLRSLGPAELLQALRSAGPALLQLLSRAGGPQRHDSIERTLAQSWQPLSSAAQALLAGLSVLRGPFGAAAVQGLCHDAAQPPWPALDELVQHSMLQSEPSGGQGGADGPRYTLFQPVREFAAATLTTAMAAAWRARLRAWLLRWLQALPATPSLRELREHLPQVQAALESAALDSQDNPATEAAQAAAHDALALLRAWYPLSDDQPLGGAGLAAAEAAVARLASARDQALGASLLAPMWFRHGEHQRALRLAQQGLAGEPGDGPARAGALHRLARVLWRSNHRVAEVQPLLDEAATLEARFPDPELRASLLALQAFVANRGCRDPQRGEALHAQALALWQALGRGHAVADGLYNLAVCAANARRWPLALQRAEPVATAAREQGHARRLSQALNLLGNVHSDLRQWHEARRCYRECIQVAWRHQLQFDLAYGLWNLPRCLAHLREAETALKLAAFAAAFWQANFGALDRADLRDLRRVQRLAAMTLAPQGPREAWPDRLHRSWQAGQALGLARAVALALR